MQKPSHSGFSYLFLPQFTLMMLSLNVSHSSFFPRVGGGPRGGPSCPSAFGSPSGAVLAFASSPSPLEGGDLTVLHLGLCLELCLLVLEGGLGPLFRVRLPVKGVRCLGQGGEGSHLKMAFPIVSLEAFQSDSEPLHGKGSYLTRIVRHNCESQGCLA